MPPQALPVWFTTAPGERLSVPFAELPGVDEDNFLDLWPVFIASCRRLSEGEDAGLRQLAQEALAFAPASSREARAWLEDHFVAHRIAPHDFDGRAQPFVTGYFEPEVAASRVRSDSYPEPARARPADLVDRPFNQGDRTFTAARRLPDGSRTPYWTRAEIDAGRSAAEPVVWLRDAVELFIAQVQGSARLRFEDGSAARLAYDGKNGHPYASVGKLLIEQGHVAPARMSLETLTDALRRLSADPAVGRTVLHHNPSYVFFRLVEDLDPRLGPVGTQGVPLTPFRSLAVDGSIWPLGLPFWVAGAFPWPAEQAAFRRMMVAQDTGSAIVGPGRGDIFCGSGPEAGRLAGLLRHGVDLYVFAPRLFS